MILDACVLIALLDPNDEHHARARRLLAVSDATQLVMSAVNLTEALIHPARIGRLDDALALVQGLRVRIIPLAGVKDATQVAIMAAASDMRAADACALHAASQQGHALATFDKRLERAADAQGITLG